MEPFEQAEQLAAAADRRLRTRPLCRDCGREIQTRYTLRLDGGYLCWGCVDDRRVDSEEEFDGYH